MGNAFKAAGLTQAAAARIVGMPAQRVTEAMRQTPAASANRRTLDLLLAVWPELDDAARQRVVAKLQAGRGEAAAAAVSPAEARRRTLEALRSMIVAPSVSRRPER